MSVDQLKDLARGAAEKTLHRLRLEIAAIERTFPELASPRRRRRAIRKARERGREVSAAARKAVSRRMKKYWKERRKAKKNVT
jgi:hypothetical protein